MTQATKPYRTGYKKSHIERDTYIPRSSPKGMLHCRGCGAIYYRRRWTLTPPPDIRDWAEFREGVRTVLCPACRKIGDQYPLGEVLLAGVSQGEREEIVHILRNAEKTARANNPLERIMDLVAKGSTWKVTTTTENLAQRLGRCLVKARGGKVAYKWSHNNKFVRVLWEKAVKKVA
jgi:hypothetical protein